MSLKCTVYIQSLAKPLNYTESYVNCLLKKNVPKKGLDGLIFLTGVCEVCNPLYKSNTAVDVGLNSFPISV